MKEIVDATISKHPIKVPEEEDLRRKQKQLERLAEEITRLEQLAEAKKSPIFLQLVEDSWKRLQEIERRRMFVPVTDTIAHAEIVGQWNERFLVTQELANCENKKVAKLNLAKRIKETLAKWSQMLKRKDNQ